MKFTSLILGLVLTMTSLTTAQPVQGGTISSQGSVRASRVTVHPYIRLWRDLQLWCRSDRGAMTTFGGSVGAWLDFSRWGRHLGQENLNLAPRLDLLGSAGYPELEFDGYDVLEPFDPIELGSYTLAVVLRFDDAMQGGSVLEGADYDLRVLPTTGVEVRHTTQTVAAQSTVSLGRPHILMVSYEATSGTTEVFLDGQQVGSGSLPVTPTQALTLGGLDGSFAGGVSEVMLFRSALTPSLRSRVQGYLAYRYLSGPQLVDVEFEEIPQNAELVPRDLDLGVGRFPVSGTVREPGYATVIAYLFRDGQLAGIDSAPLLYSGNSAPFDLELSMTPGRYDYELEVRLLAPGQPQMPVAKRIRLCCGDVFAICGQSNALSADYEDEGLANQNQDDWIRSFGSASPVIEDSLGNDHWDLAGGLDFDGHSLIGQWPLKMAREITTLTGIPVAIVNGAVGSTIITDHQKNTLDPTDSATIYGRLLRRLQAAGLDDDVRAYFWYQGESDTGNGASYAGHFDSLRLDLMMDYPLIEKFYVFQIRGGCGALNGNLREVQRNLRNTYADVEVMSTTSIVEHNGCHFRFVGYDQLGVDIGRQVRRDLYASGEVANVDPPQLASATWLGTNFDSIRLTFENPTDALLWEPGTEEYVFLDDFLVTVDAVTVNGNEIDLTLSRPAPLATIVNYVGYEFDGPSLKNANGVGALVFFGVPIQ